MLRARWSTDYVKREIVTLFYKAKARGKPGYITTPVGFAVKVYNSLSLAVVRSFNSYILYFSS